MSLALTEIVDFAANDNEFTMVTPSDDIFYANLQNERLTDVIATIANAVIGKANATHTHSGYSASDHTHSGYATSTHTHSDKADLVDGVIPASQLPSYVDDVLEYTALVNFPTVGESGKIYIDQTTNKTYRWSGSAYVEISSSLALGETSSTAYRGDRGATAYSHSQNGDVHVTSAQKTAWDAKSDFSGSYNDLTNKPTIPTVDSSLSSTSTNSVQNKIVSAALDSKANASNTVITGTFSQNRLNNSTIGIKSHAEGEDTTASGEASHSEGYGTIASNEASHAEGENTTASGLFSHTEGCGTVASDESAHAEGNYARATKAWSHAEGCSTVASGYASHAEGQATEASGARSHAEGCCSIASGDYSHASGYYTIASAYQTAIGKYNVGTSGPTSDSTQNTAHTDGLFIVGYGTSTNARANAFRVTSGGKCFGTTSFGATGADFAELFEWADGNPNNEDRRGLFVTLDGEKIKVANEGDDYIGVISGAQAFVGNSASEEWQGKYLTDVFGERLTQEVDIPEVVDEKTGAVVTPAMKATQYVLNPDYESGQEYVMRENRKEWGIVGLLGQIVIVDDGTCVVGGHVKPTANGIGTASDDGYRVMKRIDCTHIKVLVK